jgi:hypothetical protein
MTHEKLALAAGRLPARSYVDTRYVYITKGNDNTLSVVDTVPDTGRSRWDAISSMYNAIDRNVQLLPISCLT